MKNEKGGSPSQPSAEAQRQSDAMRRYYAFHSKIYDATRWAFLFGRNGIIRKIPGQPRRILEVGCGTGKNLVLLAKAFPEAHITGLDVAEPMLDVARQKLEPYSDRVSFLHTPYDKPVAPEGKPFDLVLCSYSLSMINPGYDDCIRYAKADLGEEGTMAVVDFHASAFPPFRSWMGVNHVRMEAHLLPLLRDTFTPLLEQTPAAYLGLWQYLYFIGKA